MTYFAIITKIDNIQKHPNADRLAVSVVFGKPVVTGLNTKVGDEVIYFPSDGRLSHEYCKENNLYRHSTLNKDVTVSGYFEDNRRVRIQKFRGQISDGLVMPLNSLNWTGKKLPAIGEQFTECNGKPICEKYVNEKTLNASKGNGARTSKKWSFPLFREHFDTQQLRFYVDSIPLGSRIIITEKLHGTSHRITNTLKSTKPNLVDRFLGLFGYQRQNWVVVNGTRRTVLSDGMVDGYYGDDFRKFVDEYFKPLLHKGETIYGEIVGWVNEEKPIMGTHNVSKLEDKEMLAKYGKTITYTYGNPRGNRAFYIYRITMTNQDGHEVEYSWDQVQKRAKELNALVVPQLVDFIYTDTALIRIGLLETADKYATGESTLDFTHIREGVCLRVENKFGTVIYKHKSDAFKIMEDIIKATDVVDMEESS